MRIITPEQLETALPSLPSNPRIVTQGSFGTPRALLALLDAAIAEYRLFIVNGLGALPDRDGVRIETTFVGSGLRGNPRVDYYPARLSVTPKLFTSTLPPDVVAVQTSRVIDGKVSLGIEVQVLPGAIEALKARGGLLVAQINEEMPFIQGDGVLDVSDIDLAVEITEPVPVAGDIPIDDESAALGERLAAMIPEGATLQMGIGALPGAVLKALGGARRLRVWTELMADGFHHLALAGVLDPDHPITATFAYGSAEMYAWADNNPQLRLLRCETTNSPGMIAQQPAVTSINTALQVDLFGAVNATRVQDRIISGTGGQADFVVGALHSPGGQSIIALKSWHPKADRSTVVAKLSEATTSLQPSWVVTEQGAARIFGASQRDQALGLIGAAHPRAREQLTAEAERMGLLS
ncbi:4-hydroxybutyrate CoA-transferase [Arachnia propionica]|uniref:4-hydroxybutyrate CoA-transferase n=1 Tax=Arachnia propionica TaxID=1750 RepID=A0A3P1T7P9_9ACTN|nr:acetyl-CoA hydrolase/transferase C-terminal domain-containing protein [Arachnia propionica]MDO5083268.1 acetyl-CoA hydrolase/transferase C-terminal domain-containing protein [Arachnia propionica]RRD05452.1 4-hydroxybutyrate CoA-transferase [Arachnia propionica]